MLSTGFMIFLGVMLLLIKLPRRLILRLLKYDLMIDIVVSMLTLAIHWGTFSGVMAATVAGLLMSMATTGAKRLIGYVDGDVYFPGRIRLDV